MHKNKLITILVVILFVLFTNSLVSVIKIGLNNFIQIDKTDNKKLSNKKEYDTININNTYKKEISDKYKKLMLKYVYKNYSMNDISLINPKIIVIHSTESKTITSVVNTFMPDSIDGRSDITSGGNVNVGIHFLIDRDGEIYSIIPLDTMARHVIGLNHTAIGIENVGYSTNLTKEQLISNIKLVSYLKNIYGTIEHVIGHYEYNDENSKHYYLVKQYDKNYKLSNRFDPSYDFINTIRKYIN